MVRLGTEDEANAVIVLIWNSNNLSFVLRGNTMATTLQLERIATLVDKLNPVANKQRGMRIEAGEWNVLIDVLRGILQVDRTQEDSTQSSLAQSFAAIDHVHLGQIDITWLDADLQAQLGGQQSQGSVLTRTALGEATQKINSLGTEVARLSTLAETHQLLLDRASVDAADRSKVLSQFDARFAGVENLRTLVGAVSNDVNGLRGNLDTVLQLRTSLSDANGNPIDVAQLKTQIGDLQTLRDNLKGVDGNLLRMRDIEVRLNEIGDAAGVGGAGGLDQRIATATGQLKEQLNALQDERDGALQQALTDGITSSEGRLRNELNATVDARAQTLEQNLNTRIGDSETRTNASMDARIAKSAESVGKTANDNAVTLIDKRLAGVPEQVRATTAEMITALRTDLSTQISANVNAALDTRFKGLQTQVDTRLVSIEGRVADFEKRIPSLVASGIDTLRADLANQISDQVKINTEALRGDLQNVISEQIKGNLAEVQTQLDTHISDSVNARLAGLDEIVAKSVATATRDLPQKIGAEVKTQIDALKLGDQIKSANADLAAQLRKEQALAQSDQQATTSAAINSSVTLLRGEIGATRTELTNTINARNNTVTPVSPRGDVTRPIR
jgi:hypothetical protein